LIYRNIALKKRKKNRERQKKNVGEKGGGGGGGCTDGRIKLVKESEICTAVSEALNCIRNCLVFLSHFLSAST